MKILANKKTNALFSKIGIYIGLFIAGAMMLLQLQVDNLALYLFVGSLCMGGAMAVACYRYVKDQHKIMENAVLQIKEFVSGNTNARIECNEEGEMYRLFHEVNTLVSILNARAENELRGKEFLKNTIADISHQLKTPLATLTIYNGILKGEEEDLQIIQEFVSLSEQELDRIDTLVQNLLKVTKLDAGTIHMDKKMENLSDIIKQVEKHFLVRAIQEEKQIELEGNDTISLLCDRSWLVEAIDNIVKNGLDHIKKGSFVRIEWKEYASVIQIRIKDNGCGIHQEDLHFIFKRFYRSQFSKDTPGIGLGLPLAKLIIEAHGGTIEVDSELGIGTTFVINFLIPTKL